MNGYVWLKKQLTFFYKKGATIRVIGRSVLGRKIYSIEFGQGKVVVLQYAIHAREYATATLGILHAKMLLASCPNGIRFVLIPMANPDGTELAMFGTKSCGKYQKFLENNFPKQDFRMWKANVRGVDLNNNFNAGFSKHSFACVPSSQGYSGARPLSEPESKAIARLTLSIKPFLTISFHAKGEEIYFDYFQSHRNRKRDKKIAKLFAKDFGYKIKTTQKTSSGGFKDWCVLKLKIPSLTIELFNDKVKHPVSCKMAQEEFEKTKNIFKLCSKAMWVYEQFINGVQQ